MSSPAWSLDVSVPVRDWLPLPRRGQVRGSNGLLPCKHVRQPHTGGELPSARDRLAPSGQSPSVAPEQCQCQAFSCRRRRMRCDPLGCNSSAEVQMRGSGTHFLAGVGCSARASFLLRLPRRAIPERKIDCLDFHCPVRALHEPACVGELPQSRPIRLDREELAPVGIESERVRQGCEIHALVTAAKVAGKEGRVCPAEVGHLRDIGTVHDEYLIDRPARDRIDRLNLQTGDHDQPSPAAAEDPPVSQPQTGSPPLGQGNGPETHVPAREDAGLLSTKIA